VKSWNARIPPGQNFWPHCKPLKNEFDNAVADKSLDTYTLASAAIIKETFTAFKNHALPQRFL